MIASWRASQFAFLRESPVGSALAIASEVSGPPERRRGVVTVTPAQPLPADMNWFAVLAHHATRAPDKAITIFEGERTSYAEMAVRVAALAGGLSQHGVGQGDVVALLSYNCPEFLETIFAANYLGAIAMPINWRLPAPEVRYILEHSCASALVCDEALAEVADEATRGLDATCV